MRFSEERIRHISHLILEGLEKGGCVEAKDKTPILNDIKRTLFDYFEVEDQVDDIIREKLRSYSRGIAEGSREWEVMYDKLLEEEMGKRGFIT